MTPHPGIEKAEELIQMIEDKVSHEDLDEMIKLADLHLQASIARSLSALEKDGIWISQR